MSNTNSNPLRITPDGDGLIQRLDAARMTAANLLEFLRLLETAARNGASPEGLALGLSLCCDTIKPVVRLLSPNEYWRERLFQGAARSD